MRDFVPGSYSPHLETRLAAAAASPWHRRWYVLPISMRSISLRKLQVSQSAGLWLYTFRPDASFVAGTAREGQLSSDGRACRPVSLWKRRKLLMIQCSCRPEFTVANCCRPFVILSPWRRTTATFELPFPRLPRSLATQSIVRELSRTLTMWRVPVQADRNHFSTRSKSLTGHPLIEVND